MSHDDSLSKIPVEIPIEMKVASLIVHTVKINQEDWLLTMQIHDSTIKRINDLLKKSATISKDMQVQTDYLLLDYRVCRMVEGMLLWLMAKPVRFIVVWGGQDEMGHNGMEGTVKHFQQTSCFQRMRRFVKKYLDSCGECA